METWDYIIVGAGSSGCVVARRLAENKNLRVLVLEAGEKASDFWVSTPAGMAKLFLSDKYNWRFHTEPVPELKNRRIYWPRGKALGGSSAINGMVYTRGNRLDYDHWAELGNRGWSWKDVLPYFKKAETNGRGGNEFRGSNGPLAVNDPVLTHPSITDFVAAAGKTGIPLNADLSTSGEDGAGVLQATIQNGKRHSAYDAYLKPIEHQANLKIQTNVLARRVIIQNQRAEGVEVEINGKIECFKADKEIIISAGALNSPHLLMLSGIGNRQHLEEFRIQSIHHLPGVGENLQDHCSIHVKAQTNPDRSYNQNISGWKKYIEGVRYLLTGGGYLALGSSQAAAFVRSSPKMNYSDLEISFRPMTFSFSDTGEATVDPYPGISAAVYRVRPASKGHIRLKSADPHVTPAFHANYLQADEDRLAMIAGIKKIREIFAANPLKKHITAEMAPGIECLSNHHIEQFIRDNAKCAYHPVGSCKMGNDEYSVVNDRLQVHGISALRVIDASIMPVITSGNTNAPCIMIGEKGAAMILEDAQNLSALQ